MNKINNKKLVVAIASSALFDLSESDKIYKKEGVEKYREFQEKNINKCLEKGVAFPFVRRLLSLNKISSKERLVEVVLLSRNNHETGLRVFSSIKKYGLDISKAYFSSGKAPYKYIPSFGASLFLSANVKDVREAIKAGYSAGVIIENKVKDDESDVELRIAFDYDGVIADDSAQIVYDKKGLKMFEQLEEKKIMIPHGPGPLKNFIKQLAYIRGLEIVKEKKDKKYKRVLNIAIITARSNPSHERMINTLKKWGIPVDESFFLGGNLKKPIIEVMRPHIYFDDQSRYFTDIHKIPLVHIPFGRLNK